MVDVGYFERRTGFRVPDERVLHGLSFEDNRYLKLTTQASISYLMLIEL